MEATLTRKTCTLEDNVHNSNESYTTETVVSVPFPKETSVKCKIKNEDMFIITHNGITIYPHVEVIKARTKTFFNELTYLLIIDNAYRSVGSGDYYVTDAKDDVADQINMDGGLRTFFDELTAIVANDNGYHGIIKEA